VRNHARLSLVVRCTAVPLGLHAFEPVLSGVARQDAERSLPAVAGFGAREDAGAAADCDRRLRSLSAAVYYARGAVDAGGGYAAVRPQPGSAATSGSLSVVARRLLHCRSVRVLSGWSVVSEKPLLQDTDCPVPRLDRSRGIERADFPGRGGTVLGRARRRRFHAIVAGNRGHAEDCAVLPAPGVLLDCRLA